MICKRFVYSLIIGLFIFFTIGTALLYSFQTEGKFLLQTPTSVLFNSEDEYQSYILQQVQFDDVTFDIMTIEQGDNFWKIAKQYHVNIDTLLTANPYWDSLLARLGQKVIVPSARGTLHFVNSFDEIAILANQYNVPVSDISIQKLPFMYKYYYRYIEKRKPIAVFIHKGKPQAYLLTNDMAKKFLVREMFRSPLGGRLSSFFGMRKHPIFRRRKFHNGLDIAVKWGTPVGAACSGRVLRSGWMGGYGKAVIIQHRDGYKTLYGHLSRIYVRGGKHVKSGQIIGRAGSTGYSTGPHLHFTLWRYGKLLNPLKVLW